MYKVIIVTVGFVVLYILRRLFNGPKLKIVRELIGHCVIVTGASFGIGKQTALHLIESGATVVFANRNKQETLRIISSLDKHQQKRALFIELDLSDSKSIIQFVNEINNRFIRIDILINNAAVSIPDFKLTPDKIEYTIQVNYFGPILLTLLLLNSFDSNSRIINVSSHVYSFASRSGIKKFLNDVDFSYTSKNYWTSFQYIYAKLGIVYFTRLLAKYLESKDIKVVTLCPGAVQTNFVSNLDNWYWKIIKIAFYPFYKLYYKDEKTGAATTLTLCYLEKENIKNGAFYEDTKLKDFNQIAYDKIILSDYLNYTKQVMKRSFNIDESVDKFFRFAESNYII